MWKIDRYSNATVHVHRALQDIFMSRWKSSGFFPECKLGNTMWQKDKKENVCRNKARSDIKGARRLSTPDFIFYIHGERERERKREKKKKVAWKVRDRKQKSDKKVRQGGGYTGRETRERGAPVFRGGWKNICIHPRPSSPYIGRAIPRYRLRRLHIPKFRQPKRLSYRASAFSSPAFNPLSLSLFLSLPSLSPLSLLVRQFPYPSLLRFLSASLSSLSSLHENDPHPLALFFSLAQCASENMNPSSHCLRQRFSNFPPLCANDEGTKREIKSRSQWVREEASRRRWRWP